MKISMYFTLLIVIIEKLLDKHRFSALSKEFLTLGIEPAHLFLDSTLNRATTKLEYIILWMYIE